ncbi:MAG: hypothetical protein ACM32E_18360 [Gemmatimonadota bacterium]
MSDGLSRSFDPQGEARAVLQSAVTDFGIKVLSNATILEGICEDRLPELPREASLIASAARADVVGMLQQQASGVGPDAAVRLTAGALADSRSLDPAACTWVVREFARALGYPVSADAGGGAAGQRPAAAAPPTPTMPAAAAGAGGAPPPPMPAPEPMAAPAPMPAPAPMDAPTMMPAAAAAAGPAPTPAPGQPAGFNQPPGGAFPPPPAPGGFNQPPQPGGFSPPPAGQAPATGPMNQPPGAFQQPAAGGYRFSNPPAGAGFNQPPAPGAGPAGWGGQGNTGFPQAPAPWGPAPRARKSRGPLITGISVLVVIVLYLGIAGAASLPPFSHKPAPAPSTPAASSPAASTGSSPASNSAALAHLRTLIPAAFLAKGNCMTKTPQAAGETAEIWCHNVPNIPAGFVDYYLFSNTSDLNATYDTFLRKYAKTTRDSGSCHSFTSFTPCETPYGPGSTTAGRMVEYMYQGSPDITFTDTKDLLLMDTSGNSGNSLVTWWAKLPMPWVTHG